MEFFLFDGQELPPPLLCSFEKADVLAPGRLIPPSPEWESQRSCTYAASLLQANEGHGA